MRTLLSPRRELGEFKKRYKWMALFVVVIFGGIVVRLAQLQIAGHERWDEIANGNITRTFRLRSERGFIRDTHGRVIATNRPSYDVYLTPALIREGEFDAVSELMELDDEAREQLRARLAEISERRRTHQIVFFEDISRDQLARIEERVRDLRGVDVIAQPMRHYAYGSLGAHAIGYLNEVSADDLAAHPGEDYRAGDRIGRTGIESALESVLRGQPGVRRTIVDARGRRQERVTALVEDPPESRDPVPGRTVVLTLDMELMRIVQRAFRGHASGAAVVVDVDGGRVRALYSSPAYDLNEISSGLSRDAYAEMLENPFRPLLDKTIFRTHFPGSTFKPITVLAALQDGLIDPSQRVTCEGSYHIGNQTMRCTASHGDVDLRMALIQSCNVYVYKLAEQVGLERLTRYARLFGLGERTGIGINSEASGFLATREWYEERFGRFRIGYTLNTAIGQGNTRVTLLQLALAYGAMANGGTLYAPMLMERIEAPGGRIVDSFEPHVRRSLPIDAGHLDFTNEALTGVVNHENGTAFGARIDGGVTIAGKTGTAQVAGRRRQSTGRYSAALFNRSHAWFAGFAPAEDPQVAIVVLLEHGGAGGRNAAPIATQILQEYLGDSMPTARR